MIHHGDCLDVLPTIEAESIDAVVTDPPYELGFMGKRWDSSGVAFQAATWEAVLRVAKPGAHLLAFGGTRTYHRLAAAIEDAGWEIRDCLVWAYASGFPKSLDVSKAIDKAAGAERGVSHVELSRWRPVGDGAAYMAAVTGDTRPVGEDGYQLKVRTTPATDAAREWQGWGTALKPAWEPIVLARKPLRGTVAANVQAHGTGALNIDGCRIAHDGSGVWGNHGQNPDNHLTEPGSEGTTLGTGWNRPGSARNDLGRWPANVVLTDPIFDGDTPGVVGGGEASYNPRGVFGVQIGDQPTDTAAAFAVRRDGDGIFGYGDTGTYSRFFLVPKAARSDREPVLGGELRSPGHRTMRSQPTGAPPPPPRANVHPTVKPTELMRHLVRLVTPPQGVVLDPFLGSGTTALAAEMEGFGWIGIEREAEYVAIAEARLNGVQRGLGLEVSA